MASPNPRTRRLANLAGNAARHQGRIPRDLQRELLAARIEDHICKLVDGAPPLTTEQRDRIAALLRPSPSQSEQATRASAVDRMGAAK
jgi:hypothetical protein